MKTNNPTILFVTSECAPFFKLGGLGDVAGSLPKALNKAGLDVTVAMPFYDEVRGKAALLNQTLDETAEMVVHFGYPKNPQKVVIRRGMLPGSDVPIIFFENSTFLKHYTTATDASDQSKIVERFSFFSYCINEYLHGSPFALLHLNDWHTSLIPDLLHIDDVHDARARPATLLTIHNLAFKGRTFSDVLETLPSEIYELEQVDWDVGDGIINVLKQGIIASDFISTVSPSYAQEITTPEFGMGLEEIIKSREGRLSGILNGIDYTVWNPGDDHFLEQRFQKSHFVGARLANAVSLRQKVGLRQESCPLFGFIGRLTEQKGLNLIQDGLTDLLAKGQLLILGNGDRAITDTLTQKAAAFPGQMVFVNTQQDFHEDFEHLMYGACDFFLIPSRFEPCGLVQMLAMHYGSIPIAHAVGGLKDTIDDGQTGFLFEEYSPQALSKVVSRAVETFNSDKMADFIAPAMSKDFSWSKSAAEYAKLYQKAISL